MAILPNEFPVVVAMFLALGAWRLARRKVLARRIPAVESLGAITVLCVDKTGTLTENRMTISRMTANEDTFDLKTLHSAPLPESMHETVEYSILASRRDPFDPMELAFKALGEGAARRDRTSARRLVTGAGVPVDPGETARPRGRARKSRRRQSRKTLSHSILALSG